MGGSSTINGMAYVRGNRRGYDAWTTRYGARGWTYDEVLPYFIRSENNTDPEIVRKYHGYHGTNGPLTVSSVRDPDPIFVRLRDALVSLGFTQNDSNADSNFGTGNFKKLNLFTIHKAIKSISNKTFLAIIQQTINTNGVRATTSNNFLGSVFSRRPNLHVISRSLVTKILTRNTSDNKLEAYGVTFSTRDNRTYTVTANKEIILSAGLHANVSHYIFIEIEKHYRRFQQSANINAVWHRTCSSFTHI